MTKCGIAAAAALVCASGAIARPTELFIDVNTLSAQFIGAGAFSTSATGSIHLTNNIVSTLAGVRIDGVNQALSAGLAGFTGRIDLLNGAVVGGTVSILNTDGSTYSASITPGVGAVSSQAGQGFSIDGLTFGGIFNSPFFAGVSVGPWFFNQPRPGSVLTFAFNPNSAGFDGNSDMDLYVLVPTPQAAGLGLAGLVGLGAARRRR